MLYCSYVLMTICDAFRMATLSFKADALFSYSKLIYPLYSISHRKVKFVTFLAKEVMISVVFDIVSFYLFVGEQHYSNGL